MSSQGKLGSSSDVLIVGAGPVGLTLAAALVPRGVKVALVDKAPQGANTSRAAVVHARTLEVLERIEVSEALVAKGVIVPRFTVRDRDRALLTVSFGELPTRYPYTLMVPQNVTEGVLADRLHAVGGQVHRPYEVRTVEQDADGVTATFANGEVHRSRYAVAADGMHSTVREQAGIPFTGDTYHQSFVLADVHLQWEHREDEVMLFFSPEGLVVVAPLPGGRHRIVATVDEASEHPSREDVQALMSARGPKAQPAQIADVVWSSRFRVHHRLADHYRAGRLFLAGDAAHVHSPAGGQGMNTGIQDALFLGEALAQVLVDGAAESTLDAYEAVRRPVAEEVVAFTHKMTRVATVGSAPLRGARNAVLRALDWIPAVHRAMALNLSELGTDPTRV